MLNTLSLFSNTFSSRMTDPCPPPLSQCCFLCPHPTTTSIKWQTSHWRLILMFFVFFGHFSPTMFLYISNMREIIRCWSFSLTNFIQHATLLIHTHTANCMISSCGLLLFYCISVSLFLYQWYFLSIQVFFLSIWVISYFLTITNSALKETGVQMSFLYCVFGS